MGGATANEGALLLVLFALVACQDTSRDLEARTSIAFVSIDTLRADRVGCYGHPAGATPNIDRLAERGTRFDACISSCPMTLPSHATMMTGNYPFVHGARNNGIFVLADENITLAEVLRDAGYATHAEIGAAVLETESGMAQGFETYGDAFIEAQAAAGQDEQGLIAQRTANEVTDATLRFLETRAADPQPFFLFAHYYDPHLPHQAPPPYARATPDGYLAEIAFTDAEVGRLLDRLQRPDFLDRVLVVLTSDHGDSLMQHGELSHGVLLYDSTLHVPLIVSGPGLVAGQVVASQVGLVDLTPTILDLAGVQQPHSLQGRSLVALLSEPALELGLSTYAETLEPRTTFGYSELRALRQGDWKYIHGPRPELYRLSADPDETLNCVLAEPEQADAMSTKLLQIIATAPALRGRGAARDLDTDDVQRLAALGYAAGESTAQDGDDPHFWFDELEHFEPRGANPMDKTQDVFLMYSAMATMEEGRYEESLAHWSAFAQRNPEDARAQSQLARCYQALGRPAEAIASLRNALQLDAQRCQDQQVLGSLLAETGALQEARGHFERALECDPAYALAAFNLGKVSLLLEDPPSAVAALTRTVELAPDDPHAHAGRAMALRSAGRDAEAVPSLRRAVALAPSDVSFRLELTELLAELGQLDQARAEYAEALESVPSSTQLRLAAARFALEQGQGARALELLEAGLRSQPRSAALAALRIRVLATDADRAVRDEQRAQRLAQEMLSGEQRDDPRVLAAAATAAASLGDFEAAASLAEGALRIAREADAKALATSIEAELAAYRSGRPAEVH